MRKLKPCLLLACLPSFAACSSSASVASPPPVYVGLPAGLMERCVVNDVAALETVGDVVTSRQRYKEGFDKCAAKIESIRAHDAKAREALK